MLLLEKGRLEVIYKENVYGQNWRTEGMSNEMDVEVKMETDIGTGRGTDSYMMNGKTSKNFQNGWNLDHMDG